MEGGNQEMKGGRGEGDKEEGRGGEDDHVMLRNKL